MVAFSGTSSWNVHFQCRGGSSFILLRGLSLPNISGQGGGKIYYLHTSNAYTLNRMGGGGGGGGDISTIKSISGDIDNHENLINQV